jgi:hypothetical protein
MTSNGHGLRDRLDSALQGTGEERTALDDLLTEGCARLHELETRELRLGRRSAALAARGGRDNELGSVAAESRRVRTELERLRWRVGCLRTIARTAAEH